MTNWFDAAFRGGFTVHCVNFLFFTFIDPACRQITSRKNNKMLGNTESLYLLLAFVTEILIRFIIYFTSALQLILLTTKPSAYCTRIVLQLEGRWLLALAFVQVIMTTFFAVWKVSILKKDREMMLSCERESSSSISTAGLIKGGGNLSDRTTDEEDGFDFTLRADNKTRNRKESAEYANNLLQSTKLKALDSQRSNNHDKRPKFSSAP